jgi:hypothetical protein
MSKVNRNLDYYYGDPRPAPDLVGLMPAEVLAAAGAAEVQVVVGGPGDDPRPLRPEHGRIERQHPAAGQPIGNARWIMVWPAASRSV